MRHLCIRVKDRDFHALSLGKEQDLGLKRSIEVIKIQKANKIEDVEQNLPHDCVEPGYLLSKYPSHQSKCDPTPGGLFMSTLNLYVEEILLIERRESANVLLPEPRKLVISNIKLAELPVRPRIAAVEPAGI